MTSFARWIAALAAGSLLLTLTVFALRPIPGRFPGPGQGAQPAGNASSKAVPGREAGATLYCEFYDMMHAKTVASFHFRVEAPASSEPRYVEIGSVDASGKRTDYGADEPGPAWTFSIDEGTPVLASPDGDARLNLYGLRPQAPGVFWIEAGIRGSQLKNLEGRCRQAHFGS